MDKKLIFFGLLLLCTCCKKDVKKGEYIETCNYTYFDKQLSINIPPKWINNCNDTAKYNHNDKVSYIAIINERNLNGLIITLRQSNYTNVSEVNKDRFISDVQSSFENTAKLISLETDTINNKISIEYIDKYPLVKDEVYFKTLLFIRDDKWIELTFRCPEKGNCKQVIEAVSRSIRFKKNKLLNPTRSAGT